MIVRTLTHLGFALNHARLCELVDPRTADIVEANGPYLAQQLEDRPSPTRFCNECVEVFNLFAFPETRH